MENITYNPSTDTYLIPIEIMNLMMAINKDNNYEIPRTNIMEFNHAIKNAKGPGELIEKELVRSILSGKPFHISDSIRFLFKLLSSDGGLDKWR